MDSLNEIDHLFREGEHQKELVLNQDLKNRMSQELNTPKSLNLRIYKYVGSVAAVILLMAIVFVPRPNEYNYELMELTYKPHPVINTTTINLWPTFDIVYEEGFLKG